MININSRRITKMNPKVKELIERGEIKKALKLAGKQDIEDLYEIGEEKLLPSEALKAERIFRRILELEPENDRAHKRLGDWLYDLGRYNEAEREFEEAIMIKPDDAEYRCYLANLLVELGRYEDAEREFKKALELRRDDYLTHNDYGVLLDKWKRYGEAEREFKEALRLNPKKSEEAGIHINLGALFEEWGCYGHYEEAKREYEEAIAILRELKLTKPEVAKNLARAHYNLGSLLADKLKNPYDAKGEFKEAIRIFHEAIKNEPELAEGLALAHNNLGASLCDSEKYKEAMEEYIEAIGINKEIEKEDSWVYINLGNVYGKLKCIDLAIENFKKAIEADPKNAEANQNLVWAELNKKGVGLSWWDWWQTSPSKKKCGIFLGGAAIILSGVAVYLVFKGGITPVGLLIPIVIAVISVTVLLFPEVRYFKVKAGPFEWAIEKTQYHQPSSSVIERK
jgi:superkiller protein 3